MKYEWNKNRLADKKKYLIFMSTERNERRFCDGQVNCRAVAYLAAVTYIDM